MRRLLLLTAIIATLTLTSHAAETTDSAATSAAPYRPVTSAIAIGYPGFSHLTNTYLSPLKYTGWSAALTYDRMQAMKFNPQRWVTGLTTSLQVDRTRNPARNATMWRLDLNVVWAMMHRWKLSHPDVTLAVGPATSVDAGVLYSARNGNNPVAVQAAWTIDAAAMATWNTTIARLPLTLIYRTSLPLIGAFFSPDYGELYYEIYLGNHNGLAHFAHPGNYNGWNNLIAVDLHFGSRALRLGYRTNYLGTKVNNITNRTWTGSVVIGLTGEWMNIDPRRPLADKTKMIHALY